jgi:ferredoxin
MRLDLFLPRAKEPKALHKMLRAMGPTWLASPIRRGAQTACLIAFVVLFFYVCWPYTSEHEQGNSLLLPHAEFFLLLDPLLSISAALAARAWVWSLAGAAAVLLVGMILPRWFCGYVCPLGTMIDGFDWLVSGRVTRFRTGAEGWWVNLRYYVLAVVLAAAACGVLLSGFVAAIAIVTRGMLFLFGPAQMGLLKGWYLVPAMNAGHYVSIVLFLMVLGLGLLRPRFWCAYVCPTGALLSLGNLLRLTDRKVEATCIECGRCLATCSFDAIGPDYSTRALNCTFCQVCGGVCPSHSINFSARWSNARLKPASRKAGARPSFSRRGFLFGTVGALASGAAAGAALAHERAGRAESFPIRPPGSLPERRFRQQCVRCGECFKVCPNNVLQPAGFELGLDGLWTPKAVPDWAGCKPSCNNCGQVCPTGAIRALPLEEKLAARMGLAQVNKKTCLPYAGREDCRICVDECAAAGYNAVEFVRVGGEVDDQGVPIEGSSYLAPVVLEDKCVGCGLCQTSCHSINVKGKKLLAHSAIVVSAGPGKEDRIIAGSYRDLRAERLSRTKQPQPSQPKGSGDNYLPDFLL